MRARHALELLIVAFVFAILVLTPRPVAASADVSLVGYQVDGGGFTPIGDGGTMPVGATLEIRVWVDLYSCDPVTVDWGDGTTQAANYGGTFAMNWYHTYNAEGTYTISATEPCGSQGELRTIHVGAGGFAIFDPSGDLFLPTMLGLIFSFLALGLALGKTKPAAANAKGPFANVQPPAAPRRLVPITPLGTPYSMVANLVSFRDIPVGARRQPEPRMQFTPGEPTDIRQAPRCQCGGTLGFAAGGWFCLNPQCPFIVREQPWPRIVHGIRESTRWINDPP